MWPVRSCETGDLAAAAVLGSSAEQIDTDDFRRTPQVEAAADECGVGIDPMIVWKDPPLPCDPQFVAGGLGQHDVAVDRRDKQAGVGCDDTGVAGKGVELGVPTGLEPRFEVEAIESAPDTEDPIADNDGRVAVGGEVRIGGERPGDD